MEDERNIKNFDFTKNVWQGLCPVAYNNPHNKEQYNWDGYNGGCKWNMDTSISKERRLIIQSFWKTCFFCKKKGCRNCVVGGAGLGDGNIDYICEFCYEEKFDSNPKD